MRRKIIDEDESIESDSLSEKLGFWHWITTKLFGCCHGQDEYDTLG